MADTELEERPASESTSPSSSSSSARDDIRAAILNAKAEDEIVEVYGQKVAVRTPCLEDLLQYRDMQDDDFAMARAIANNVYVPGTDQRVFDDTDVEVLMRSKFTTDMRRLNKAVVTALGGDDALLGKVEDDTKSNKK